MARAAVGDTVRSTTEGSAQGWLKLLADPRRGTLVGATAMGGYAEEWISEVSLAVRAEVPVTAHADVVHPFPTYSEILEARCGASPRSCQAEQGGQPCPGGCAWRMRASLAAMTR